MLSLRCWMGLDWHVGDVIRKLREQRRWGQERLATAAGKNKGTIVAAEANENVKRDTLEAIARGLGMTVGQIYDLIPRSEQESQRVDQPTATVGGQFREQRRQNLGPPPGIPERRKQA